MVPRSRRAFTLIELLVVITIIAMLLALLMPGLSSAWQTAQMTQCKRHLNTIFQAQGVWRADKGSALFAQDKGWSGELLPYLEQRSEVFKCPLAVARSASAGASEAGTSEQAQGAGSGGADASMGMGGTTQTQDPPKDTGVQIAFDVYSDPSFTTYLWTVSIDSVWARVSPMGNRTWHYTIEDQGWKNVADDYKDIDIAVMYDDADRPIEVEIIQGKKGSQGYRFDLKVNGQLIMHNIDNHIGEKIKFEAVDEKGVEAGSGGGGGGVYTASGGKGVITIRWVPCDYGLSKGSYSNGVAEAPRVDGKLFFVLDFKEDIADFTDGPDNMWAEWDKYFIENPEAWQRDWSRDGGNAEAYQALRHFGQANVLFCDGHIETLSAKDMWRSPLWQYAGR